MRLLVLGGTHFVGWHVATCALAKGWDVTVLHRGNTHPPDGAQELLGDRTAPGGLAAALAPAGHATGRTTGHATNEGAAHPGEWDVVVDTWSAAPWVVRDAATALADRVGRYVYVSSASVYELPFPSGSNETRPRVKANPDAGDVDYPEAKAGAEAAIEASFGDRAVLLRAGLILGPRENINRLPWWLTRIARGGDVLAPGPRDLGIQFVDARDLAAFALTATPGAYDVVAPVGHATIGRLLESCVDVVGSDARLRWASPELIAEAGIDPWTQLPAWLPPGELHDSLFGMDVTRATAAGLRSRSVHETVADTWAWLQSIGGMPPMDTDRQPVGVDPDVEARVLAQLTVADGSQTSAASG